MRNSLGRAPVGRSDTGMTTGWTEGTPWEIAWGCSGGKERYGSDDRVDGRETVGNSSGGALLGGSDALRRRAVGTGFSGQISSIRLLRKTVRRKTCQSFQTLAHGTCIASLAGSETKRAELLARIFQDKFHQHDCPEKLVPKTSQTVSKRWAKGHAGHAWEKVLCWRSCHFARRSVRRCLVFAPIAAKQTKR